MEQHRLTRAEQRRGLVFFALYFLVFPFLKLGVESALDHFFGLYLSEAMSAAVYYYIMAVLTMVVFWGFLKNAVGIFRQHPVENLLAMLTGLIGGAGLQMLVHWLPWPLENPNNISWAQQYSYSYGATILIVVFLMPAIEEVLFRGLVFGALRRRNRALAWIMSVGLFMVYSVWTFAVAYGDARYLILAFQYLPLALAVTWCYDRGGSIWSAAILHAAFDAIALFQVVH